MTPVGLYGWEMVIACGLHLTLHACCLPHLSRSVSMPIAAPSLLLNAGIRKARLSDVDAVQSLLQPLEKEGVLVKRSRNELEAMMHDFIVIERETKVSVCGNGVGG